MIKALIFLTSLFLLKEADSASILVCTCMDLVPQHFRNLIRYSGIRKIPPQQAERRLNHALLFESKQQVNNKGLTELRPCILKQYFKNEVSLHSEA